MPIGRGSRRNKKRKNKKTETTTKHLETGPGSLQKLWPSGKSVRTRSPGSPVRQSVRPFSLVEQSGFRERTSGRLSSRRVSSEFRSAVEPASRHLHLEKKKH